MRPRPRCQGSLVRTPGSPSVKPLALGGRLALIVGGFPDLSGGELDHEDGTGPFCRAGGEAALAGGEVPTGSQFDEVRRRWIEGRSFHWDEGRGIRRSRRVVEPRRLELVLRWIQGAIDHDPHQGRVALCHAGQVALRCGPQELRPARGGVAVDHGGPRPDQEVAAAHDLEGARLRHDHLERLVIEGRGREERRTHAHAPAFVPREHTVTGTRFEPVPPVQGSSGLRSAQPAAPGNKLALLLRVVPVDREEQRRRVRPAEAAAGVIAELDSPDRRAVAQSRRHHDLRDLPAVGDA